VIAIRPRASSPAAGDRPSFYRPSRERFTGVPHYSSTCEGVLSNAVELTVVLANLDPVVASWRVLYPNRSGFEGSAVVVGCPVVVRGQARGAVDGGPYKVQRQLWRRPAPVRSDSAGVVAVVRGVALQGREWPHRADSDGDDRSRWPDVTA
jgi:hypothetical protein